MGITVHHAAERYIQSRESRVGLKGRFGRQAATIRTLAYDTRRAITPIADRDICALKRSDVELALGHWMGQDLAPRSAYKYVTCIKHLLDYADAEIDCFVMPKGVAGLIDECRPTPEQMRSKAISEFDGGTLAKVLAVAPDQVRLYALLGLQCGMYQQDISDLTPGDIKGEYMVWSRSKTDHQSALTLHHWLWPETRTLIERCRSKVNAHNRLLVTTHATPLVTRTLERTSDSIGRAWDRACDKAGVSIAFKDLRKWGASAIARIADLDTSRMYRGETIKGSSSAYVLQAFEAKLTPALAKWHEELQPILDQIA